MPDQLLDFLFAPYAGYATQDIVLEVLGVIFGLLSVWYAKRENIWVFPTGIISTGIYVYLLFYAGLYGDMGINAYYFAMSIYGWYIWSRPTGQRAVPPVSRASRQENRIGLLILLAAFGLVYLILLNFTDSTVPLIDAFTTAIFFVGMWFMARKQIENWIYWIIGDFISIPLYHYKGLTLTSIQYIVFLGLAISGYLSWRKSLQREASQSNSSVAEEVPR